MDAYVYLQVTPGKVPAVLTQLAGRTGLRRALAVVGEWDVLVQVEGTDLDQIAATVLAQLHGVDGVVRTLTAPVVPAGPRRDRRVRQRAAAADRGRRLLRPREGAGGSRGRARRARVGDAGRGRRGGPGRRLGPADLRRAAVGGRERRRPGGDPPLPGVDRDEHAGVDRVRGARRRPGPVLGLDLAGVGQRKVAHTRGQREADALFGERDDLDVVEPVRMPGTPACDRRATPARTPRT